MQMGRNAPSEARGIGQCVRARLHVETRYEKFASNMPMARYPAWEPRKGHLPIGAEVDEGLVRHDDVRPILEAKVASAIEGLDLQ